jgi:hypothetical protein
MEQLAAARTLSLKCAISGFETATYVLLRREVLNESLTSASSYAGLAAIQDLA